MPKGSHVTMVDDDKILVDMYKERLELAGYKVTICKNGEEGLAKTREEKPDIILLDVMMPKVNGYEVLASLKSDPQTKDIPVVMLSALMRDFNREKAVEAGADDYLIKSEAMPADVITKIEQVLQKYGKGSTPVPGVTPSASPPPSPPPPPATTPPVSKTDIKPPVKPPEGISSITPSVKKTEEKPDKAVTPPEKIIFEPAKPAANAQGEIETEPVGMPQNQNPPAGGEKREEIPVVTYNKPQQETQKPPSSIAQSIPAPKIVQEKQKSPGSMALIVILTILLTALINDLLIYYFFIFRK